MLNPFIAKLNEKNLCSWYILPMLNLSPTSIGIANFINAYQVEGQMQIAIHVADINLCRELLEHPSYLRTLERDGTELLIFEVPIGWRKDYEKFLAGKYSKMSEFAKQTIREKSGLNYEVTDESGNKITDAILLALERHRVLQEKWMEVINLPSVDKLPDELLSLPRPESFIQL